MNISPIIVPLDPAPDGEWYSHARWRMLDCYCHFGVVNGYDLGPLDCTHCGGGGFYYILPSGHVAAWPGGPFMGKEDTETYLRKGRFAGMMVPRIALIPVS